MIFCPCIVVSYAESDNGWTIVVHQGFAKFEDQRVSFAQKNVYLCAQDEILLCIVLRDPVNGGTAAKGVAGIKRGPNIIGERVAEMSFNAR